MNTKQNKVAFTLVELIVVITILAILGTIAFISLQNYSKSARDSARLSDLSSIKTTLELFHLNSGKYPETTDGFSVVYSGSIVWNQGTFGQTTFNNIEKLDKIPLDPLTSREYTYSITKTKQEYQLGGIMENDGLSLNIKTNIVNAGDTTATALVTGNYNGKILKTQSGVTCEILSVPSIISSQSNTTTNLVDILTNKGLVYNGYKNLPSNYISSKYNNEGGFNFVSNKLIVYSDNDSCNPLYDVDDSSGRNELLTNLNLAYALTIIENEEGIDDIVNIDLTNSNNIDLISSTLINNSLGGKIDISNKITGRPEPLICIDMTQAQINTLNAIPEFGGEDSSSNRYENGDILTKAQWCDLIYFEIFNGVDIPEEIGYLTNLTDFYFDSGTFTSIPTTIGNLTNLVYLDFRDNSNFSVLPNEIGNLINLEDLYLSSCNFSSLPSTIGNLVNLEGLYLEDNNFISLPSSIGNLTNLEYLDLIGNIGLGNLNKDFLKTSTEETQEDITIELYGISISGNGNNIVITVDSTPTNGICGDSNGQNFSFDFTNLCSTGNSSNFVDNGVLSTYTWKCNSPNGGTNMNCNANHIIPFNFGGINLDSFNSIIFDGTNYVAVGRSDSDLTGIGGNSNQGSADFIIAKFDSSLNLININNFGGTSLDYFTSIFYDGTNYVAVGNSVSDLTSLGGYNTQGSFDFVIAKFNSNLDLININNFGGTSNDYLSSVIFDGTNYITVGRTYSDLTSIGGSTTQVQNFIIAKFDSNLSLTDINNSGGTSSDDFTSILLDGSDYIAVGNSSSDLTSLGGSNTQGNQDFVIAKYDSSLNLTDINNIGGTESDYFKFVIKDGTDFIAVGESYSNLTSLGGTDKQGPMDGVIAKFDSSLNLSNINNLGGIQSERFFGVTNNSSNYIVVGYSDSDLTSLGGSNTQGDFDFIINKFDSNLNLTSIDNFGGTTDDHFYSVAYDGSNYVIVGDSDSDLTQIGGSSNQGTPGFGGEDFVIYKTNF